MLRLVMLLCLCAILITAKALARTWHIKPDGTGDAPTIQAGVDSAGTGDTVLLAAGIYTGDGNRDIDISGKAIVLRSESGIPSSCVIDCEGTEADQHRGLIFPSAGSQGSVVEGLTITGGYRVAISDYAVDKSGAGIYCAESCPAIRNCVFSNNTATWGAGIFFDNCDQPEITGCLFSSNTASVGGGILCRYSDWVRILGTTFSGNSALSGGAVAFGRCAHVEFWNSIFEGNSASEEGAALWFTECDFQLYLCTFYKNVGDQGAFICIVQYVYPTLEDGFMDLNSRPACSAYAKSAGRSETSSYGFGAVSRCTICGNSAPSGALIYSDVIYHIQVTNTIIAYNPDGCVTDTTSGCMIYDLMACDIYGNADGDWIGCIADQYGINGNFSACPSFCDAFAEPFDLRLCDQSPCAPGNHPDTLDCGLIGAWDVGCACGPTKTEATSWGGIKAMYR